jgi:PAS domain S-box-containing protein
LVRLLLNSTGEGIYGIDLEGRCTFANPACLKLLGFQSDDQLVGHNMHRLVHHTRLNGDPYPETECRIYLAFREGEGTHVDDEVMFSADGRAFPAEYWSYPIHRDGELVGCVVTFVDITERRRVEEDLRQTEKMSALGKLSAGVAHELNNPAAAAGRASVQLTEELDALQLAAVDLALTGVGREAWTALTDRVAGLRASERDAPALSPVAASDREEELGSWLEANGMDAAWELAPEFVSAGVSPRDLDEIAAEVPAGSLGEALVWFCRALAVRGLADTVARSAGSISELVGAVKSYSHMDQAAVSEVDIHEGLDQTLTILAYKLQSGIDVAREYERDLPRIETRGGELNQVWTNLIDNAIGALGQQGTITIRTFWDADHLAVEIADDGRGIPEEIRGQIFDPFFTTKDVGEGTGLGLDIVRRIVVERFGGQVDVRSRPGETVFRVRLPVE